MATHTKILIGIIVGIVCGAMLGGWIPEAGIRVGLLGEAFLNLLMMLVIPLVIFSMIVGVTGLGDVRKVGSLGLRTIGYYFATTGIAVSMGLLAVNLIKPGEGVSPGEQLGSVNYTVGGVDGRTVTLDGSSWARTGYGKQYVVVLEDQKVRGRLDVMTPTSATVALWERIDSDADVVNLRAVQVHPSSRT